MEELIPLVAIVFALMIPIIAMLTYHQRKMAEIIRKDNLQSLPSPEVDSLRREISQLRDVVGSLAINVDNLKDEVRGNSKIQDRIGVNE